MLKRILLVVTILGIIGAYIAYDKYQQIFAPNVSNQLPAESYLFIPTNSDFEDVLQELTKNQYILDTASFVWVADRMNYKASKIRSGRFKIEPGMSNRSLINHLRSGRQAPVKLILTNERLPEDIAGKVAGYLEADSLSIYELLTDEVYLDQHGYTPETVISAIIPNTYELYWNQNAKQFFERMLKEKDKFWNKNKRLAKAKTLNMSPEEVYNLASIVERETNQRDEMPRIAGVYLNRLKKGILLQADPTVVFATRDFLTRRVTYRHLEIDSPYNTYKYAGLPPGPISMASIAAIDAVLNAEDHDYIFFCAKGDGSGYHAFAKSMAGHSTNIRNYNKNLRARGLR